MGAALGAGITFMLRRGPTGRRPIGHAMSGAGRGLKWAGKHAWKAGREGAEWAGERGEDLWEAIPRDEIRRGVSRRMDHAKDTIDDAVQAELRSLRRALRRRRKQLGL
jgi:hypothetical protein